MMNTFKMRCVNYLLVRGWEQDVNGYEWYHYIGYGNSVSCETLGQAIAVQLEWDDEACI